MELLESNSSHFDISRPIEFKPPGKLFAIGDKEQHKSSYLVQNNESVYLEGEKLIRDMNAYYHVLEMYIDYKDKKVKAKSLNWYQQASIAIHLLVETMVNNAEKEIRESVEENTEMIIKTREDTRSQVKQTMLPKLYTLAIHLSLIHI